MASESRRVTVEGRAASREGSEGGGREGEIDVERGSSEMKTKILGQSLLRVSSFL